MTGGADIAVMKAVLDTSGMKRGANEGAQAVDQLTKSTDNLDSVLGTARKAAMALGGVLGAYRLSSWIKGSIDLAARYETLGVVLTQVSKSAGYAGGDINRLTSALEKQGISMLQARQSVISMIQAKLELANADKLAAVAQNAAVTAGLNSSETLQRIIFGITSSQTDVLRTIGLTVSFEEAYNNLSKTLKKSVSDLTLAEKQQARVNAVLEAGKPIAGAYGASMETAGKQVKSMERYVEDLRIKVGQAFQPAYTSAVFAMSEALKFMSNNVGLLLTVIGAVAGRGMAAFIMKINESRLALVDKMKATSSMNNESLLAAKSEGLIAEATTAAARAKRAELVVDLERLNATKAAIIAERELVLAKRQGALASAAAAAQVPLSRLAPLGGAAVAREEAKRAATTGVLSSTINDMAQLGQQQARVDAAIVSTTANVGRLTAATSLGTRALGVMGTAFNFLGGGIGIALIALGAFYTNAAAQTQKAKELISANADDIKKKMDEISSRSKQTFGTMFDTKPATAFNQKLEESNDKMKEASKVLMTYAGGLGSLLKSLAFGGLGQFSGDLGSITSRVRDGNMSLTEASDKLDVLEAKYPKMAAEVRRAREAVALFGVEQDKLNKFLAETPAPLMAAAAALDYSYQAFKSASTAAQAGPAFLAPALGDKGTDTERDIANLKRMQEAIKSGSKSRIQAVQDEQSANSAAQSLIDSRIKSDEKLSALRGKTLQQIIAMGPVADKAIQQLQVDAAATYAQEKAKNSLIRTNERLADSEQRALTIARERASFLEKSGGPSQTPDEQFETGIKDYRRSMRDAGQSPTDTQNDIEQARKYNSMVKITDDYVRSWSNSVADNAEKQSKLNEQLEKQNKIMAGFVSLASGVKGMNKELQDQAGQIAVEQAKKSGSVTREQLRKFEDMQLMANKAKEFKDKFGVSDEIANKGAEIWLKQFRTMQDLTKSTKGWSEALQTVGSSLSSLSTNLNGTGADAAKVMGVVGSSIQLMQQSMKLAADMKKNPDSYKMSGAEKTGVAISGAIGAFGAGYGIGSSTTSRTAGTAGGALAGAATGALAGTAILPGVGTAIGAAVGAVVGAVGGFLGASQAAKAAAAQAKLASEQLNKSMEALRATFANDRLGAAIAGAKIQFDELRKATEATYKGRVNEPERFRILKEINALEAQRIQMIKDEFAITKQLDEQNLEARSLRSRGLNDEADRMSEAADRTVALNEAIRKYGADSTYVDKLREIQQVELEAAEATRKRNQLTGNFGILARGLDASGDSEGAAAIRRTIQYEDELREARERGYDISALLLVQQKEIAQIELQRLQTANTARRDFEGNIFTREVTLNNGGIAGQLAGKAVSIGRELDAANKDTSLSPEDRERIRRVGIGELNQMTADFRKQAVGSMQDVQRGLVTNPVEAAVLDGIKRRADAESMFGEYLRAGIITQEEYNRTMQAVATTTAQATEEAKKQVERTRAGFLLDMATRQSEMNPMDRGAAKLVYDMQGDAAYNDAYDNAVKLRDAGIITSQQFADFASVLAQQFSPAVRDAAFATAEAARIMQDNMNTLNQQWNVFGTDAAGQLADVSKLYGFEGKSFEQVQAMFTKATPGVELTAAQREVNSQVSTWIDLFRRAQPGIDGGSGSSGGGMGLDAAQQYTTNTFTSVSEQTALRMFDVEMTQLSVLRSIENNTRGGGEGGISINITMSGTALVAQSPYDAAKQLGNAILPVLLEGMGRKVGVEKRLAGEAVI